MNLLKDIKEIQINSDRRIDAYSFFQGMKYILDNVNIIPTTEYETPEKDNLESQIHQIEEEMNWIKK